MIRAAKPQDIPFISWAYGIVQDHEGTADTYETNHERIAEWFVEGEERTAMLVAALAPNCPPYGCIVIRFERDGLAFVGGLYVEPGSPRRTALELMDAATKECSVRGVSKMRIVTGNSRHATYERIGFQPYVTVWEADVVEAQEGIERRLRHG